MKKTGAASMESIMVVGFVMGRITIHSSISRGDNMGHFNFYFLMQ